MNDCDATGMTRYRFRSPETRAKAAIQLSLGFAGQTEFFLSFSYGNHHKSIELTLCVSLLYELLNPSIQFANSI